MESDDIARTGQERARAIPRRRKLLYLAVANATALVLVLAAAELGLRWYRDWRHGEFDRKDAWVVPDELLGYRFNPARDDVNEWSVRHPEIDVDRDVFRIIVLGDSVAAAKTGFVTLVRERLAAQGRKATEVINAAVPGYTTFQERHFLERDLIRLKPDLVLLQYCLNDNHRILHRFDEDGRFLITEDAKRALFPEDSPLLAGLTRRSYLVFEIRKYLLLTNAGSGDDDYPWQRDVGFQTAWRESTWRAFEEHVVAMRDIVRRRGARFGMLAVPFEPQLAASRLERDRDYTLMPQRKIRETCARAAVPFLDLVPDFLAARDRKLYKDGIHLTAEGHRVAAEALLAFLDREGLTD